MSLDTFKRRMADNVPGKIYVGDQCLDCDLCRETAPQNFGRNDDGGYSCVKKQPETPEEMAQCREAIEGCCSLDPLRPEDAREDADGDGLSNYEEMLTGTDPQDTQSALRIQLVRVSEGWLELFFPCSGGKLYHLERSNALGPPGWSLLGDPRIGSSSGQGGFSVPANQLDSGDLLRVVLKAQ